MLAESKAKHNMLYCVFSEIDKNLKERKKKWNEYGDKYTKTKQTVKWIQNEEQNYKKNS